MNTNVALYEALYDAKEALNKARALLADARQYIFHAQHAPNAERRHFWNACARQRIAQGRAWYARANATMQANSIPASHHYVSLGGAWRAVVAIGGDVHVVLAMGARKYAQRQSAQRAALRMVGSMQA